MPVLLEVLPRIKELLCKEADKNNNNNNKGGRLYQHLETVCTGAHRCNSSPWEVGAGGSKVKVILSYTENLGTV